MKRKRTDFSDAIGSNIKQQEESKQKFGYLNLPKNVKLLKLEDGTARVDLDFVPYLVTDQNHPDKDDSKGFAIEGEPWYRRPIKVHRGVGVNNETVLCPTSVGQRCPICEYKAKRQKQGAEKDELKELYPKRRSLYVLYPNSIPKYNDNEIVIWDMSDELFQVVFNEESKINPEIKKFVNLEDGVTLTIKFRWKKFGSNSFPETRSIDANPRKDLPESVLDEAPSLDDILKVLSFDEIEAKFFEEEKEPDGGKLHDVDEDKPSRGERERKSEPEDEKPVRGRRSEETEDEKPTRGRGRKEDTEPEVEEKPTRGRSTRGSAEPEDEKPTRGRKEEPEKTTERSRPAKSSSDPECPHGHVFGEDAEKFPEHCDTCKIWGKCLDKKEGK